ncbi:MAG: 1-(5-phosphoribosyl)-5-[(5-phosphoribosylamino)methylideneamino]imidazole-4-carboxamide isomerase [Coriobacteriia bacterium]|nr:1-(5-phosphoribosyl)-5-[(5-phosphoribosylamino)methylideneamino]imidazole-4-carboxamide isomerase [Coriobacteriia bacterium]
MQVFPAIDLLGGRVVRLAQGDYERVTVYSDDPVAQAQSFFDAGAQWLHVVDLDGARAGEPRNTAVIARIVSELPDLRIEVGGGLRSLAQVKALLDVGVTRVILGSTLAHDPAFARAAVAEFGPDALVAGVDARDGLVAVEGWTQTSTMPATELVSTLASGGLRHLVYTDIARDGMQRGIQAELYTAVAAAAGFPVVVSGGVATLGDVAAAACLGPEAVEGVIIGRALYEKVFTLEEAINTLTGTPVPKPPLG